MKVTVKITKSFKTAAKPLLKKYQSLSKDLLNLEKELIASPRLGTHLGKDTYKIRLKVTSKGKGKSGGVRVISLVETLTDVVVPTFLYKSIILPVETAVWSLTNGIK